VCADSIPGWWVFVYWVNPVAWALKALAVNEFTAQRWAAPYEAPGPAAGLTDGQTLGHAVLSANGISADAAWIGAAVGYLAAYIVVANVVVVVGLAWLSGRPGLWNSCAKP
jgi:Plant PDR ABC transporter associated